MNRRQFALGMLAMPALIRTASAQVTAIRLGKQNGLAYLPQMVMESEKLIEKHAASLGLPSLEVNWSVLGGPGALNDALLSGGIEFINVALPSLTTLWEKTAKTPRPVRALCTVQSMPYLLVTRNLAVKTIADFTAKDKIAVPTAKISLQAIMLQMAAANLWGLENYEKLDPLTVTLGHPDALAAMLSGHSEISAHFGIAPFHYYELAVAGMHTVLDTYQLMGGPHTNGIQVTTTTFHDANPKICQAVSAAHQEANAFIKKNSRQAADIYIAISKDKKSTPEELVKMIEDPANDFTVTPAKVMAMADFMHKTGRLKVPPNSWKDLFLPEAHDLNGS
jgi:NitT/TauT family transport system substrate-binding protein